MIGSIGFAYTISKAFLFQLKKDEITIRPGLICFSLMLISNIFATDASNAKGTGFILLGLRLGSSLYVTDKGFMTYEVFTIYKLPWSWRPYLETLFRLDYRHKVEFGRGSYKK